MRQILNSLSKLFKGGNAEKLANLVEEGAAKVKGGAAAKAGEELTKEMGKAAESVGVGDKVSFGKKAAAGATLGVAAAATLGLQSCGEKNDDYGGGKYNVFIDASVKIDYEALAAAVAKAMKPDEQIAALVDIKNAINTLQNSFEGDATKKTEMLNKLEKLLDDILKKLGTGNNYLLNIYDKLVENNAQNDTIIAKLTEIQTAITELKTAVNFLPEKIKAELGDDYQALLEAINNNTKSVDDIKAMIKDIVKQMCTLIKQNNVEIMQNATQIKLLFGILGRLNSMEDVLNEIKGEIRNMNGHFDTLFVKLDTITQNQEEQTDIMVDIYSAIQNMDAGTQDKLNAILNAIMANGGKVDDLKALLEMINNNVVADTEQSKANTAAIIEAIQQLMDKVSQIKIDAPNVDLSALEAMMRELIGLTQANNGILTGISGKVDLANATLTAILAKIPAAGQYKDQLNAILTAIQDSKYDDSNVIAMLSKLLGAANENNDLLVKILAAIKDHKVDVNVVVECLCNHADDGNNEGIIREIESLIS